MNAYEVTLALILGVYCWGMYALLRPQRGVRP